MCLFLSIFEPLPYCFDDCSFVIQSEVRKHDSSSFVLVSEDVLAVQGLLYFHINFRIVCSGSGKMPLVF